MGKWIEGCIDRLSGLHHQVASTSHKFTRQESREMMTSGIAENVAHGNVRMALACDWDEPVLGRCAISAGRAVGFVQHRGPCALR